MSRLFTLPNELIIEILLILDISDILKWRQICKYSNETVINNLRLKYKIKLAFHNMLDNPASNLTTDERIRRLSAYGNMWTHAHEKDYHELDIGGDGVWELSRGVIAQAKGPRSMVCVQLPSLIRQSEEKRWELPNVGIDIAEFTMDPEQDLLVLIENSPEYYYVHIRTLTRGEAHPLACKSATLERYKSVDFIYLNVKVTGDFVAVGFLPDSWMCKEELAIWNWKTGNVHLNVKGDFVYAYSFLSLDQVIVAAGETRLSGLQVISLSTSSQSASLIVEDMAKIEYDYFLRFPEISDIQHVWHVDIRSDPLPSIHRTSAPFFVDTDKRMFLLTVSNPHYGVYEPLSIIISGEQLLKAINNTTVESQRDIRWKDWGLTGCFFSSTLRRHDHTWHCNVYGTRLINLWNPGLPEFYILDCSKYGHPSLDTDISSEEDNNRERMFEGLAHANSPGLSFTQHGPLAVSGKMGVCDAVMMSEDNIVFVDSRESITKFYTMSL